MNKEWNDVREFHLSFSHPAPDCPVLLNKECVVRRYNWMKEELDEFKDAVSIPEQADAMIDLIYFALGTLVEMGVKPDRLFSIVHKANMGKLWSDGSPRYNEENKVIKPSNWTDPHDELLAEINRQSKECI